MRDARRRSPLATLALAAALLVHGCALTAHFAYTNTRLETPEPKAPQASFEIRQRPSKQQGDVLVLLALSGGGSRAAYFSARTMQALERVPGPGGTPLNVLNEIDLISSVSGGSLAAAYYSIAPTSWRRPSRTTSSTAPEPGPTSACATSTLAGRT